ncbi:MAG: alpha-1,4-glucan--maltose-1-phosphate maltosyltransferase [Candidatus Omnitrophica bacterium]|nr:alpha-1,4-glucan--maltose-1-phosphate maltosyltransferase [Candidatus Omnitrophota bacterium]
MNPVNNKRVIIEGVWPEIDGGRFPAKRVTGEKVTVEADIFSDGHDEISAVILYKKAGEKGWREACMKLLVNDKWEGVFTITDLTAYYYTVEAWADPFKTWQKDLKKKLDAGQDVKMDLLVGIGLMEKTIGLASVKDAKRLKEFMDIIKNDKTRSGDKAVPVIFSDDFTSLMFSYPDRSGATRYDKELEVAVDRPKALFSTWYEMFPRSCGSGPGKPGSFKTCKTMLSEIARMGFDVLYLPPIHPVGKKNRKGKNNTVIAQKEDPGSPWAIGSEEGGHKSIDPSLGTIKDFQDFMEEAGKYGIEIAMDIAFQCSPSHPYIKEHPEWFKKCPDGTMQYAENPPKKYEDIVPFNFESDKWKELWEELKSIVLFWIEKGVRIFRVDNPHTKPFNFWEWLIKEIKKDYPDAIFLAEAFTRPKVMHRLAKLGFTQSYTYFTWRNKKYELTGYLEELTRGEGREYLRPNFWPNTPDILPEYLQYGGRSAFLARLILAATLSSNYGVFGPEYELCISNAIAGKEEYLDSEKYEVKNWDWNNPDNLRDIIARVNRIRRENPALQTTWNIKFHDVDNELILFYSKKTEDLSNIILVAVNLDPHHRQSGWVKLPLNEFGLDLGESYLVHDLLSDDKYIWKGESNYIELNPFIVPAHIFCVKNRLRRETDFDYYM